MAAAINSFPPRPATRNPVLAFYLGSSSVDEEEFVVETQSTGHTEQPAPRRRKKRQHKRLQSKFKSLLAGIPDLVVIDRDPLFQALLCGLTNQPPTTVNFQVISRGSPVTVVGVPTRIWANPKAMAILMRVKQRMLELHRTCVLLPQGAINAEPTLLADPAVIQRLFSIDVDQLLIAAEI